MRSIVTPQFRKLLDSLPERVQEDARAGFERWKQDPQLVGWKALNGMRASVYSVQIGMRHRAIAVLSKEHNTAVWMYVGSHEDYNNYVDVRRQMTQKNWLATSMHRLEMGLLQALKQRRQAQADPAPVPHRTPRGPAPG